MTGFINERFPGEISDFYCIKCRFKPVRIPGVLISMILSNTLLDLSAYAISTEKIAKDSFL
ncbi:MAG: hypothetical protein AO396_01455 [Candidatus Fermentibacter daniensis]|nr:MAG: hypothetical protein AO396_01455 [Candidatus Fermentibacter daniensis]